MSSFIDAIKDPAFRADVMSRFKDAVYRGAFNAIGGPVDAAAGVVNAGLMAGGVLGHKAGLLSAAQMPQVIERPIGGSEWLGGIAESRGWISPERNPSAEILATLAVPAAAMRSAAAAPLKNSAGTVRIGDKSRRSLAIFEKPNTERPFDVDYTQGAAGPAGSKLQFDIEGRPLVAEYVAGRRVVQGMDEGITGIDQVGVASKLGFDVQSSKRSVAPLNGDAGKYVRSGPDRRIYIDESLTPDKAKMVLGHELSHGIDDLVQNIVGKGGSKIPTDGIKKELQSVYEQLNTAGWFKPGRGMTPQGHGYKADKEDSELIAEAIRAYIATPGWLKQNAPKTAARIRSFVNDNPNINKVIQFNSAAGALYLSVPGVESEAE